MSVQLENYPIKHLQLSERHRLAMLDRSPKPRSER